MKTACLCQDFCADSRGISRSMFLLHILIDNLASGADGFSSPDLSAADPPEPVIGLPPQATGASSTTPLKFAPTTTWGVLAGLLVVAIGLVAALPRLVGDDVSAIAAATSATQAAPNDSDSLREAATPAVPDFEPPVISSRRVDSGGSGSVRTAGRYVSSIGRGETRLADQSSFRGTTTREEPPAKPGARLRTSMPVNDSERVAERRPAHVVPRRIRFRLRLRQALRNSPWPATDAPCCRRWEPERRGQSPADRHACHARRNPGLPFPLRAKLAIRSCI